MNLKTDMQDAFKESLDKFNMPDVPCGTVMGISIERFVAIICEECDGKKLSCDHIKLSLTFSKGLCTREELISIFDEIKKTPNLVKTSMGEDSHGTQMMEFLL